MGQRRKNAVFMPGKFVFPGGAVDHADGISELIGKPNPICLSRLSVRSTAGALSLLMCAIREVWEETGLRLCEPQPRTPDPTAIDRPWRDFCNSGAVPSATGMVFIFRAVTPPGNSRRFDARFFYRDVDEPPEITGLDDLSAGSGELCNLRWVTISEAERLDIPFITRLVFKSLVESIKQEAPPASVPFHFRDGLESRTLDLAQLDD